MPPVALALLAKPPDRLMLPGVAADESPTTMDTAPEVCTAEPDDKKMLPDVKAAPAVAETPLKMLMSRPAVVSVVPTVMLMEPVSPLVEGPLAKMTLPLACWVEVPEDSSRFPDTPYDSESPDTMRTFPDAAAVPPPATRTTPPPCVLPVPATTLTMPAVVVAGALRTRRLPPVGPVPATMYTSPPVPVALP